MAQSDSPEHFVHDLALFAYQSANLLLFHVLDFGVALARSVSYTDSHIANVQLDIIDTPLKIADLPITTI